MPVAVVVPQAMPAPGNTRPPHVSGHGHSQWPPHQEPFEDELEMLRQYDTVFVVDDSFSMMGTLWREVRSLKWGLLCPMLV